MLLTTKEIIAETNEIADGLIEHAKKGYGRRLLSTEFHELKMASIKAASNIMQGQAIGKVFENKCMSG